MTSASSSPLASRPPRQLPRAGASKAQAALARIIAVISAAPTTAPPPPPPPAPVAQRHVIAHEEKAGGFRAVDLGLRLGPPPTPAQEIVGAYGGPQKAESCCGGSAESGDVGTADKSSVISPPAQAAEGAGAYASPAASMAGCATAVAAAKSSEGECDPEEEAEGESKAKADEHAKGVVIVADATKGNNARCGGCGGGAEASMVFSKRGHGGHLDLLLEAVRKVSGGFFDDEADDERWERKADAASLTEADETPVAGGRSTRRSGTAKRGKEEAEWAPFDLYEETAPIVRSKRGRSQALPSRYRDSVMEPWRKPPAVARHGRSTTKP